MPLLQTAIRAVQAAEEVLRRARTEPLHIQSKGFRDIVTDADLAAERAIVEVIRADYPDHAILSEEDAEGPDLAGWTPPPGALWVIDPLDGTTNYARGIPAYCASVGVMVDGVLQAGAITDPAGGFLFAGARGQGVTLNGRSVRVSDRGDLSTAVVACDWPHEPQARARVHAVVGSVLAHCRTVRCHGSAALNLAYVAAGWCDAYLHLELKPWDMAAGVLMILEAGGQATTLSGEPFGLACGSLLASNGALHQAVLEHALAFLG